MRTIDDVREAFLGFAEQAPAEVDLFVREPVAPQRRHAALAIGLAVGAVVAVAATVTVIGMGRHRSAPANGPHPAPVSLRFDFRVDPALGYTVDYSRLGQTWQEAYLTSRDHNLTGFVTLFAQGAFDPTEARKGTQVDVNGHPGYYADIAGDEKGLPGNSVAWQYAPAAWALVWLRAQHGPDTHVRQEEIAVAGAVRPGRGPAPRVPFRIGYLPPELAPNEATVRPGSNMAGDYSIGFSDASSPADPQFGRSSDLVVGVSVHGGCRPGSDPAVVAGRYGCFENSGAPGERYLHLQIPGGWLTLDISSPAYAGKVLDRIVASMTFAPLDRPASWFDADTAIPR